MKKLILLSALLIFACSSDEGSNHNNNSNQTFLEIYDGVTWKYLDPNPGEDTWYDFVTYSPTGFNECEGYDGEYYEYSYNWGDDIDGIYNTVIENSPDRLVVETIETYDDGSTYTYIFTTEATNNGNSLVQTSSDFPEYIDYYDRVSSNPCN